MEDFKNNPVYLQLSSYIRKLNTSIRRPPRSRGKLIGHGDKDDDPRMVIAEPRGVGFGVRGWARGWGSSSAF